MKKNLVTILLLCTALTSCGGGGGGGINTSNDTGSGKDLKITFFNGGYGEDWIRNLASRFEEEKGVKVEIVKSEEGNCGAENYIKSGYNLSDIYIAEGVSWKALVQEGYLEDLTDVYEAEVETKAGPQKIKDFMDQGIVGNFYLQRALKDPQLKPWAMPWTAKPNAMAYNEDILKEIRHVSTSYTLTDGVIGEDGKWVDVPQTVEDLKAFCEDVVAFNNNSPEKQALGDTHKYVPLGWCGSINADSVGFLVTSWWAEAQGLKTSNYPGEGSYYDFFNFGNTVASNVGQQVDLNVFNQSGLKKAYDTLADILVDSETHQFKNTINDPYNTNLQQLQQLFVANKVNEKPVLAIASSYLENEVIKNKYIDSDLDGKQDVNFKFMNVPKFSNDFEDILYLNFSDSMVVPAKAPNKALAKEFLKFMSSEQEILNFARETGGGIRPFNCDIRTEASGNEYTPFANSLFDVYYNSTHVYEYPENATSLEQVSHIFRYGGPSYNGNVEWLTVLTILQNPGDKTPGEAIHEAVLQGLLQNEYDSWVRKFRLTEVGK